MKKATLISIVMAALLIEIGAADENQHESRFTGEILPVFYVTDVMRSVEFYRDILGFEFKHFYDYDKGDQVKTWESDEPPIWALMSGVRTAPGKIGIRAPGRRRGSLF
jgi:hypothetical protein